MDAREILKRPYKRLLIPDADTDTFTAMIAEFPGCIAQGKSAAGAYAELEASAEAWLEEVIESGMPVPEPEAAAEFSGRVVLRMPRSTHAKAVAAAERDGVSLNTFLVAAVSERLGQHHDGKAVKNRM